jgi:hypothetical protein
VSYFALLPERRRGTPGERRKKTRKMRSYPLAPEEKPALWGGEQL